MSQENVHLVGRLNDVFNERSFVENADLLDPDMVRRRSAFSTKLRSLNTSFRRPTRCTFSCDIAYALDSASRSAAARARSEEHTSELQSRFDIVCRLLLEKKKKFNVMLRRKERANLSS